MDILNPLQAKFFLGNIKLYLHFISLPHTDMTQVIEILPQVRQRTYPIYIVNIMSADALAMQGDRASATMISTMLYRNNSVPAC